MTNISNENETPASSVSWPSSSEMKKQLQNAFPSFDEIEAADGRSRILRQEAIIKACSLLRDIRKKCGYSQRELAARMDVSQPTISQLETADPDGNGPTIASLVDYLNYCGSSLSLSARPLNNANLKSNAPDDQDRSVSDFPDLLNSIDICYLETDANDCIVRSNDVWKRLHAKIERWTVAVPYADFLKAGMDNGLFPAAETEPNWFERRMENHLHPTLPFDVPRQEGILLEVSEKRKREGGTITIGRNVTIQRRLGELFRSCGGLEAS